MSSRDNALLRVIGLLMQVPGAMALVSIPICLIFKEYYAVLPFALTATLSLGLGQFLYRRFRQEKAMRYRQTLVVVALGWAVVFTIGAIPYFLIASVLKSGLNGEMFESVAIAPTFQSLWNALFESISGFTTTGLSMTQNVERLPHCLQWWRSFTQWVGGIGLMVLTLSILEPSNNVQQLYSAEARDEKLSPTLRGTAQEIWKVYLLYTGGGIVLLWLTGMPLWAAINHGMSAISTGGFSISSTSLKPYSSLSKLVVAMMMIAGATSFTVSSNAIRQRKISIIWQDTRHRALWILLGAIACLLLVEHHTLTGTWALSDSLFQATSSLTTCGFSTVAEEAWSPISRAAMTLAMTFGAVSGSTGGGLKLDRVVVLYKSVEWYLRLIYRESPDDLRYKLNGQTLSEKEAHRRLKAATVLAMLWLSALIIGTFILFHITRAEYSLTNVLFECASALGTSGLSIGITGPDLPLSGKLTLMFLMWLGRLEIISVLVLFSWLVRIR